MDKRQAMSNIGFLSAAILAAFLSISSASAQSGLIRNLQQGKSQRLVVYGTSLSSGAGGMAWVVALTDSLNKQYNGRLSCLITGKPAMWSTWGVQHLEDSVIAKKPDAVMIEFAINDAFESYRTPPAVAGLNLEYMINRIKLANPDCEIILQLMNPPVGEHEVARPDLQTYYEIYRRVAKKYRLLLIDHNHYWQAILAQGLDAFLSYVPDGIHPSEETARTLVAPFIRRVLMEGRQPR